MGVLAVLPWERLTRVSLFYYLPQCPWLEGCQSGKLVTTPLRWQCRQLTGILRVSCVSWDPLTPHAVGCHTEYLRRLEDSGPGAKLFPSIYVYRVGVNYVLYIPASFSTFTRKRKRWCKFCVMKNHPVYTFCKRDVYCGYCAGSCCRSN
jgi:hypothetical protein